MKIVVTTGPSYEPIDEVRRLTNFSTGELGIILSERLAQAGYDVICLRGVHATHPHTPSGVDTRPFTTNDDLHDQLSSLAQTETVGAIFQVAALCDYKVARVEDAAGSRRDAAKIESRSGQLTLVLTPARKVLAGLRALYPDASLVGWKYELNGGREEALAKAWRQLQESQSDACVLNGRAWGSDFAFCTPPDCVTPIAGKSQLAEFLARWLAGRIPVGAS